MNRTLKNLPNATVFDQIKTPVGLLTLFASDDGLQAILWENETLSGIPRATQNPWIVETKKQLSEYFAGTRTTFDLPLLPQGTPFQMQAWRALQSIPYGQTISYGEQAKRLGDAKKARAVGMANGKNPVSIIIPCHRVIGSTGHLTGFGGGLSCKQWLLDHEKRYSKQ